MPKILIVDDEAKIRRILKRILDKKNYDSKEAESAKEARQVLKNETIDLVLSDVNMPEESGLDLMRFILKEYRGTAVVAVTIVEDLDVAVSIIEAGAYGYILKPFDINSVLIQVSNALHRRKLEVENRMHKENLEKLVEQRTLELQENIKKLETTERALRDSEEKFRKISLFANDAIITVNEDGRINYWNKAAERIFGYLESEVSGKELHSFIAPNVDEISFQNDLDLFKSVGQIGTRHVIDKIHELQAIKKDGSLFPIEMSVSVVKLKNKWQAIGIIRDISERKSNERKLKKINTQIKQLLASISSILIGVDQNNKVFQWNSTAENVFHIESKSVIDKPLQECPLNWEWEKIEPKIETCRKSNIPIRVNDIRFMRNYEKEGFLEITINPIYDDENKYSGFLLLGEDVTEKKILESNLAQANKLESIGQLAAGIAHEINTPAQYVGDNTRFLQEAFTDLHILLQQFENLLQTAKETGLNGGVVHDIEELSKKIDKDYLLEEIPNAITETLDGVERVTEIVRAMKEFSHSGSGNKTAVDLNKAIESTITVTRNEWKYVADMKTDFDRSLPLVHCLPSDLNQVILNIIVNAAHAIEDSVGKNSEEKGQIKISTSHDDEFAEIRIQDTGIGIPEETINRIFDPFFTTKEVGRGSGQGLAIAHSIIVDKHDGMIDVESEVGKGTTFIIQIPIELVHETKE